MWRNERFAATTVRNAGMDTERKVALIARVEVVRVLQSFAESVNRVCVSVGGDEDECGVYECAASVLNSVGIELLTAYDALCANGEWVR